MRSDRLRLMDMLDAIDVVRQYLPPAREAFDRDPPVRSQSLSDDVDPPPAQGG